MCHGGGDGAFPVEGAFAAEGFVADDAETVGVGGAGGVFADGLFGADVLGGAHDGAGAGDGYRIDGFGDAEVTDFDAPARGDEDVAGFDVPVDDAFFVGGAEALGGLREHVQGLGDGEGGEASEGVAEGFGVDEFHHKVGDGVAAVGVLEFAVVVDGDDVGVVEAGGGAGLFTEAGEEVPVG